MSILDKNIDKKEMKCEKLFGELYLRGTICAVAWGIIVQLIGINVLNIFSNRIITDLNEYVPDEKKILANQATQIVGITGAVAVFISIPLIKRFGRKSLSLGGAVLVTLTHFLTAFYIDKSNGQIVVLFMLLF